ncbi:hypothetical protein [Bacillus sp. FJAT-52991]|uniref:Uncharacterized protein n=1 Tax=Bacillus kandeliae TaxID=3129297 RepID=A0ABZ2N6Q4_9BACI
MNYNGIIFVCLVTFYFPLFVWLSFNNRLLLNMPDSYGLTIIVSIILLFSAYMLSIVMRDRGKEVVQ